MNTINERREAIKARITRHSSEAVKFGSEAEYYEDVAANATEHAKVAAKNLKHIAELNSKQAAAYREKESKAISLRDEAKAELEEFERSIPVVLTVEERLERLESAFDGRA